MAVKLQFDRDLFWLYCDKFQFHRDICQLHRNRWFEFWHKLLMSSWISNYIHYKMWDEITCPFTNINGATVEVWGWKSNFIPHFTGHVITYPCWDLSHSVLSKGAHEGIWRTTTPEWKTFLKQGPKPSCIMTEGTGDISQYLIAIVYMPCFTASFGKKNN